MTVICSERYGSGCWEQVDFSLGTEKKGRKCKKIKHRNEPFLIFFNFFFFFFFFFVLFVMISIVIRDQKTCQPRTTNESFMDLFFSSLYLEKPVANFLRASIFHLKV